MKTTKSFLTLAFVGISLLYSVQNSRAHKPELKQPVVQIALLLDTSNSMDGLIRQAKSQLWNVVNEFIEAKQNGKTPIVQLALYEYGNDRLQNETRWIRRVLPLTRDLDAVSEELFGLTTNGGSEFCGSVIERAVEDLHWDASPKTYKAIFIAGNEPFTQGPVDPKQACSLAIQKGVVVNTIHCGQVAMGIEGGWKRGATLAEGSFLSIDQDRAVVHIDAPQDKRIEELNIELNNTYIVFGGEKGNAKKRNQVAQDSNAVAIQSIAQRAVSKASANYYNNDWDLVDACKDQKFSLKSVKKEELPEEMREMTDEEREAYVQGKADERKKIQAKILELNKRRQSYVAEKLKEEAGKDETVGSAIVRTIRTQAAERGITFEEQ